MAALAQALVGDAAGAVGDAGALLGEFQDGALGVGEHRALPPGRDQVDARGALSGVSQILGVRDTCREAQRRGV
ncbi:hypothetical protein [Nonomuraea dietziae]|uniref:Uncharacterized protein n=1 Tax=Nonomuraea dietziae TaxID=65515 RepID=A0A7W5VJB7_9ACTN|nr:hypothetical protein [Nonomuraea dietziae]MBB3733048.1 hypothetical protein [Nonomuraea dietziae]